MIYHELTEEATVYRVFEVLNSRGLAVRWLDKTKSQLMASIYEHVEQDSLAGGMSEMQTIWKDIYRTLGLDDRLGDEALRFAGTFYSKTQPSRVLSDEDASAEILRVAGTKLKSIVAAAAWLKTVVPRVLGLHLDPRRAAVIRVAHARFLATAIMLRGFDEKTERNLLRAWERVTFRIYTLAGKDARTKVGDYVRLGYDILAKQLTEKAILKGLGDIGKGYSIDEILTDNIWENWYQDWSEGVRYLLYRYEEYLAEKEGGKLNESQWAKIWIVDPSQSIEHIAPQSSEKPYIHHLGNLTMLPPKVNSALKDKPPIQKAPRYIQCGLQATMEVGHDIQNGLTWNEQAILARAKRISDFVREEWAG